MRPKKSKIMHATDAGNETELSPIRLSTPKHKRRIINRPMGTYIQAVSVRCHDSRATCDGTVSNESLVRLGAPIELLD